MVKKNCFVIMPITVPDELIENGTYDDKEHFKDVFDYIIEPAIKKNDWKPIYPKTKGSKIIIEDIINNLIDADMVVCDISILNPNVFYEAGIRTAVNKPIAYIKDDTIDEIPFDTSGINHETYKKSLKVKYQAEDIEKLFKHFKETFEKSDNQNPAWNKFGLKIKAEKPDSKKEPFEATLELLMDRLNSIDDRTREIGNQARSSRKIGEPIDVSFERGQQKILIETMILNEIEMDKNLSEEVVHIKIMDITKDGATLNIVTKNKLPLKLQQKIWDIVKPYRITRVKYEHIFDS